MPQQFSFRPAKKGAGHTQTNWPQPEMAKRDMGLSQEWRGKKVFFKNDLYSRCARKQSTPALQDPVGKRVVTSPLGRSSLGRSGIFTGGPLGPELSS